MATRALTLGLSVSICSKNALSVSTHEIFLLRMALDKATASSSTMSEYAVREASVIMDKKHKAFQVLRQLRKAARYLHGKRGVTRACLVGAVLRCIGRFAAGCRLDAQGCVDGLGTVAVGADMHSVYVGSAGDFGTPGFYMRNFVVQVCGQFMCIFLSAECTVLQEYDI